MCPFGGGMEWNHGTSSSGIFSVILRQTPGNIFHVTLLETEPTKLVCWFSQMTTLNQTAKSKKCMLMSALINLDKFEHVPRKEF